MPIDKASKEVYNNSRWYRCPVCEKKLLLIASDTKISNLHYKCKQCHEIININVPEKGA